MRFRAHRAESKWSLLHKDISGTGHFGGSPRRMIVIPFFVLFASFVVYSWIRDDYKF
ncbi:hypothetical protein SV7mr_41320 [Stieleria bergensis]|uniref:Uncharacterized protein n=1 Tax=Stieleria bergensis TaxID=2528025 RepID=A0A517SZL3_9BACT|nr:hypothetical protein SV7mr_41320 [Planctomycetes bacterium SV_7m_r]